MNDDIVLQLAISAYNAYGDDAGWKTWNGKDMPQWDDLGIAVQSHWIAAVAEVVNALTRYRGGSLAPR